MSRPTYTIELPDPARRGCRSTPFGTTPIRSRSRFRIRAKTGPIELFEDLCRQRLCLHEHSVCRPEYVRHEQTEARGSPHLILVPASHEDEAGDAELPSRLHSKKSSRERLVAHEGIESTAHFADLPDSQRPIRDQSQSVDDSEDAW